MAFRDDRDAQLARAEALDRENRRLREELAERERALAEAERDDDAVASDNLRLRQQLEQKEQRERELREALARERGPGLLVRIGRRIAALRLAEPSGEGGYWSAALSTWRLYVPVVAALSIPAVVFDGSIRLTLIALGAVTPLVAALLASSLWLLNRRRRTTAAAGCSLVIGLFAAAAWLAPTAIMMARRSMDLNALLSSVVAVYLTIALLHLTRGVRLGAIPLWLLPIAFLAVWPTPASLWVILGFTLWGGRLADPRFGGDFR
jgi:hypothetical protein